MAYLVDEQSSISGQPIELYCFNRRDSFWTQTSANIVVVYDGKTYAPTLIRRGDIEASINTLKNLLDIEVDRTNDFAINYIYAPVDGIVTLTIYRGHAGSYVPYWKGTVLNVKFKSKTATITAGPKTNSLRRTGLMRKFGRRCGLPLYSSLCTVLKASNKVEGNVSTVSGVDVNSSAFGVKTDDWFVGGPFESGDETRMIVYHVGNDIKLASSIRPLKVGDAFQAFAGCNHTSVICKHKFDNKLNYGGQEFIPDKNPFVGDPIT